VPSILDLAKPVGEFPNWIHLALFGPPGSGKTVFAGTGYTEGRVIHFDVDGTGAKSFKNHPEMLPYIDRIRIRKCEELLSGGQELRRGGHDYKVAICDTISTLQELHVQRLMRELYQKNPEKRERYKTWQDDFYEAGNRIKEIIEVFCDLDMHVVFIFHQREDKDEMSGIIRLSPAVIPSLGGTIATLVDITGYYTCNSKASGEEERKLRVKPTNTIQSKTRNWFDKPILINPTFKDLLPQERTQ
jgi:hypothetical protein